MSAEYWPSHPRGGGGSGGGDESQSDSKSERKCRCKNTNCAKFYCDCFSAARFCSSACRCVNCHNNPDSYDTFLKPLIERSLPRAPPAWSTAVEPPPDLSLSSSGVASAAVGPSTTPTTAAAATAGRTSLQKGCKCKRSKCMKNYCECRSAGLPCSNACQCVGCRNVASKRHDTPSSSRGPAVAPAVAVAVARAPVHPVAAPAGMQTTPARSAAHHFKFSVSDDPHVAAHYWPGSPEETIALQLLAPPFAAIETPAQQEQRILRHLIDTLKSTLADSLQHQPC